jgi:hypothetical protein
MLGVWNCVGCDLSFEPEDLSINRDEIALCRSCLEMLKAGNDKIRNCPNDRTLMEKQPAYELLLIDKCPSCGGVWLGSYELKVINNINNAMKNKSVGRAYLFGWLTG